MGLLEGIGAFSKEYKRRPKGLRRVVSEGAPIDIAHVQSSRCRSFIEKESEASSEEAIAGEEAGWGKLDLATPSDLNVPNSWNMFAEFADRPEVEGGLAESGVLMEEEEQFPELPRLLRKQTSDCFLMPPRSKDVVIQSRRSRKITNSLTTVSTSCPLRITTTISASSSEVISNGLLKNHSSHPLSSSSVKSPQQALQICLCTV